MLLLKFCIVERIKPKTIREFLVDHYLQCRIYIVNCGAQPHLNRSVVRFQGRLPSCAPYFYFEGHCKMLNGRTEATYSPDGDGIFELSPKDPNFLQHNDMDYIAQEAAVTLKSLPSALKTEFRKCRVYPLRLLKDYPELLDFCDLARYPFVSILREAFVYKRKDQNSVVTYRHDQEARIAKLSGKELRKCHHMLMNRPHRLCFRRWSKEEFNLKEMSWSSFRLFIVRHKIHVDAITKCMVRFYDSVKKLRHEFGDTIFSKQETMNYYLEKHSYDKPHFDDAFNNLMYMAFTPLELKGNLYFAFDVDYENVCAILCWLQRLGYKSQTYTAQERAYYTPCRIRGPLCEEQERAAKHILANPITCLQGGPGTGKSETGLVWLLSRFKSPLIVTYTGMMVNSGRNRMGGRKEVMTTIHSVIFSEKIFTDDAYEWLLAFDVLVIDESSNVDERLFGRLINILPSICKLVLLGDLDQVGPISAGCIYRDFCFAFPHHKCELTENHRVSASGRLLVDAAQCINNPTLLENFPLPLIDRPESLDDQRDLIAKLVMQCIDKRDKYQSLLNFQVITMKNVTRKQLNAWIEEVLIQKRILNPRRFRHKIGYNYTIFQGKKIMFTKNIKNPKLGEPVFNGELGVVRETKLRKKEHPEGLWLILYGGKKVFLHIEYGVDPKYIQDGYVTTVNKAQGSEWNRVIFWIHPIVNSNYWTREFPYVAVSRAKQHCDIVGYLSELQIMCKHKARHRRTLLSCMLETNIGNYDLVPLSQRLDDSEVIFRDPNELMRLPLDKPAVPVLVVNKDNHARKKHRTNSTMWDNN